MIPPGVLTFKLLEHIQNSILKKSYITLRGFSKASHTNSKHITVIFFFSEPWKQIHSLRIQWINLLWKLINILPPDWASQFYYGTFTFSGKTEEIMWCSAVWSYEKYINNETVDTKNICMICISSLLKNPSKTPVKYLLAVCWMEQFALFNRCFQVGNS